MTCAVLSNNDIEHLTGSKSGFRFSVTGTTCALVSSFGPTQVKEKKEDQSRRVLRYSHNRSKKANYDPECRQSTATAFSPFVTKLLKIIQKIS